MSQIFNRQNLLRFGSEAILIIFSLLLALILNEYRNNLNEKKLTSRYLDRLKEELVSNQNILEELLPYHKEVLINCRKAYASDSVRSTLFSDGKLDLFQLAPKGLIKEIPSSVAWDITMQSGLSRNFEFDLLYLLSKTYQQQELVMNSTLQKLADKVFDPSINSIENQDHTFYFFSMSTNELYAQELSLLDLINATLEKIESMDN